MNEIQIMNDNITYKWTRGLADNIQIVFKMHKLIYSDDPYIECAKMIRYDFMGPFPKGWGDKHSMSSTTICTMTPIRK